jgi:DNA repair photolyase
MSTRDAPPTQTARGSSITPKNRFERLEVSFDALDDHLEHAEFSRRKTEFLRDSARSILTRNDSPDIGFFVGLNPYRGCEHGCAYCYARQTHEYLGFNSGIDFESRIMVKLEAAQLLRTELSRKRYAPEVITLSGITDVYQPAERHFKLTRACLEVLLDFRHPVVIITKNALVTRDVDLLRELAQLHCVSVAISLTTLDDDLRTKLEPRTSSPSRRLAAMETLSNAGVPVGVMTAPIIPGLTDHEIPALVREAANAGASWSAYGIVRLPYSVKDVFQDWLERFVPERKNKVLGRIRDVRNGELSDSRFGYRQRGEGEYAQQIKLLHRAACRQAGLPKTTPSLTVEHFRVPGTQAGLFD